MAPNSVVAPGRDDQAARGAAAHVGAEEDAVACARRAARRRPTAPGVFSHREALAGQHRLAHEAVGRLEDDARRPGRGCRPRAARRRRHDLLERHELRRARRAATWRVHLHPRAQRRGGRLRAVLARVADADAGERRSRATMTASAHSPVATEATAANTSRRSSGLRSWSSSTRSRERRSLAEVALRPSAAQPLGRFGATTVRRSLDSSRARDLARARATNTRRALGRSRPTGRRRNRAARVPEPGSIGSQKLRPRNSSVAASATRRSGTPTITSVSTDAASNVPRPPGMKPDACAYRLRS